MTVEEQDLKLVRDAAEGLGEYFDSVQIFCSRDEGGLTGTSGTSWGSGNWYARYGQAMQWLRTSDSRREIIADDGDDK